MKDRNLLYLEKQWLHGQPAQRALKRFSQLSPAKIRHLLRDHNDDNSDEIADRETWQRDEFDYLLGFYSLVEIALMIGFISEIPPGFVRQHLPVIAHPAVRQFYEVSYPLQLPRRLRERLQSGIAYRLPPGPELIAAFFDFLELTKLIERDEDMESFLWALDGGWRNDGGQCDISIIRNALSKPQRLARAVQTRASKRNELDRALNGFCKFIQFCESFAALLARIEQYPDLAEAFWLSHSYWLRQMNSHLGNELKLALASLLKWTVQDEDKFALEERVSNLQQLIVRLAIPPMSRLKLDRNKRDGRNKRDATI